MFSKNSKVNTNSQEVLTTSMRYTAFTLAEVLITLAVIGVVAAIAIPSLQVKIQKKQYVIGLKKFYVNAEAALQKLANEKGCRYNLACTGLPYIDNSLSFPYRSPAYRLGNEFIKYLNIEKVCLNGSGNCFADLIKNGTEGASASYIDLNAPQYFSFTTVDGMSVALYHNGNEPTNIIYSNNNDYEPTRQLCIGELYVDVNGKKGPNFVGRDIFYFGIVNGDVSPMLHPGGYPEVIHWRWPRITDCRSDTGMGCAYKIMKDSWKMDY